jgi:hypothetical protein
MLLIERVTTGKEREIGKNGIGPKRKCGGKMEDEAEGRMKRIRG